MQCAWGRGNRKEKKKKREGKGERKGKGWFNWKGGRLPSSGLWEQWGHTSQLPSSLRNQAQRKQTHLLFEDTWSHLGPQPQHARGRGDRRVTDVVGGGGQEGPWARHSGSSGNGVGVRNWGQTLGTMSFHTFPQRWSRVALQKENSQSPAPAPALQTPVRAEEMLPDM